MSRFRHQFSRRVGSSQMTRPELIAQLRQAGRVELQDEGASTLVRLRRGGFLIEICIPDDVYEWFVDVKDERTGTTVLQDWMDHYATEGESNDDLESEMCTEV